MSSRSSPRAILQFVPGRPDAATSEIQALFPYCISPDRSDILRQLFGLSVLLCQRVKNETAASARSVLFAKVTTALGTCLSSCHIGLDVVACHYSKLLVQNRFYCLKNSQNLSSKRWATKSK